MSPRPKPAPHAGTVEVHPATAERWSDVAALFGPKGACAGCWCMWPRLQSAEYKKGLGEGNRRRLQKLVRGGAAPGLLAYAGGEPIGWVALAPRTDYTRLEASKVLAPVDDTPVWSVVCFFVRRDWRGRGLTVFLLEAAARYAAQHGARMVEGYPTEVTARQSAAFIWTGVASMFEQAGFEEVARRSPTRPIMRRAVAKSARRKVAARSKPKPATRTKRA